MSVISILLDVTPKTAYHNDEIAKLLEKLPQDGHYPPNPDQVAVGFKPFSDKAVSFSIGKGEGAIEVEADPQHIFIRGSLKPTQQKKEAFWLSSLLKDIFNFRTTKTTEEDPGSLTSVKNPFL